MKKTVFYAVALCVVSLIMGIVAGVAIDRQRIKSHLKHLAKDRQQLSQRVRQAPKEIFERLSDKLHLDEKQKTMAKEILENARGGIEAIGKETRERLLAVRNESNAKLQEILNPEQQKEFQKIIVDLEAHNQKARRFLQERFGRQPSAPGETPAGQEHLPPPPPPASPEDEELPPPPETF